VDLRGKECPRFPRGAARSDGDGRAVSQYGTIHRGCCAKEVCSDIDARGHVRCGWEFGGKERYLATLVEGGLAARKTTAAN
jgi:hypothetical protein